MKRSSLLLLSTLTVVLLASIVYPIGSAAYAREQPDVAASVRGAPATMQAAIVAVTASGNTGQGRLVYAERCAICHDKGGMGPTLKGATRTMDRAAAVAWIKNPKPPMPKLYPSRLNDAEVNDVAAYVDTLTVAAVAAPAGSKATAHAKMKTAAGAPINVAQGKKLYGVSCAGCHGATGTEGGAGPSLKGEKNKKDVAALVGWIENPKPPMPKLYPSPLGAKDVSAIAAYVETL